MDTTTLPAEGLPDVPSAADAAPVASALADAPVAASPEAAVPVVVGTNDAHAGVRAVVAAERTYPSLYDTTPTTLAAVAIGVLIVAAIQVLVVRMYSTAKSEHVYLTRFVTSLVGMIVGCYIADLLIAGPDTSLLTEQEHTLILTFIKDTALMIFSYYFGLKAQAPKEGSGE